MPGQQQEQHESGPEHQDDRLYDVRPDYCFDTTQQRIKRNQGSRNQDDPGLVPTGQRRQRQRNAEQDRSHSCKLCQQVADHGRRSVPTIQSGVPNGGRRRSPHPDDRMEQSSGPPTRRKLAKTTRTQTNSSCSHRLCRVLPGTYYSTGTYRRSTDPPPSPEGNLPQRRIRFSFCSCGQTSTQKQPHPGCRRSEQRGRWYEACWPAESQSGCLEIESPVAG